MNKLNEFHTFLQENGFDPVFDDSGTDDCRNLNWNAIFITVPCFTRWSDAWEMDVVEPDEAIEKMINAYCKGAGIDLEWGDDPYGADEEGKDCWILYASTEPKGGLDDGFQDFVGYSCHAGGKLSGAIQVPYEFLTPTLVRIYTSNAGYHDETLIEYHPVEAMYSIRQDHPGAPDWATLWSTHPTNCMKAFHERHIKGLGQNLFTFDHAVHVDWKEEEDLV